jgi:survival-of-motor-neuron-related-splicing factor 30
MDTRSQLAEVDELIATDPNDESLRALREDLLQLIALEEQESSGGHLQQQSPPSLSTEVLASNDELQQPLGVDEYYGGDGDSTTTDEKQPSSSSYTAQSAFMQHNMSNERGIAEAPDLGSFRPVVYASKSSAQRPAMKSNDDDALADLADLSGDTTTADATVSQSIVAAENKQKKKKKKSDDAMIEAKFELPSHLVPLESDTPAQRLKKQRTAKALKSKFREKQKEAEHSKRQSDWKTFATKAIGKKKKGVVIGGSMFSTEEGVNARVGVISGGAGGRKMTDFEDPNKRRKFT